MAELERVRVRVRGVAAALRIAPWKHAQYSAPYRAEGVLICSIQFIVCSATGSLYLAVNRQGTIVYNLSIYAAGHLPCNLPAGCGVGVL